MDAPAANPAGRLTGVILCKRYFLRQFVGSGGAAEVYLAWDQFRSAKMAVKVLRPDVHDRALEHFEHEAELLQRLEHPFIVRRYELERDGRTVFLVMDWVEGANLRQRIQDLKQPLSLEMTGGILNPVCSALNFTHQNGIYHCDIKPANILLHVDGRVLLTDFGVARLSDERRSGGTPAYMAPEQIRDDVVDERTDIYSLGVTLFEMLSGRQPFRGDSQSSQGSTPAERVEWEHCYLPPPSLGSYNPGLPQPVLALVEQAMSKEPTQRPRSVLEFLEAFEQGRRQPGAASGFDSTVINLPARRPIPPPVPHPQPPIPPPRPSVAAVSGPHLVGVNGQYAGQPVPIPADRSSIGRAAGSDLWLAGRSVSRVHAALVRTRRGVYIEDAGSTAGTFVNDRPVAGPVQLRHGDIIRIGIADTFEYRER